LEKRNTFTSRARRERVVQTQKKRVREYGAIVKRHSELVKKT